MKSNMRRAFAAFSPADIERMSTPEKQDAYKSILFGLCFYHGVLLGRKKFGIGIGVGSGSGMGFCRAYSFNMGDLTTCADVLRNYLEANDEVPWDDLRYMFGEVFYGASRKPIVDPNLGLPAVSWCITQHSPRVVPPGRSVATAMSSFRATTLCGRC